MAIGKIIDDRAMMTGWPWSPLKLDSSSSLHSCGGSPWCCIKVADDVRASISIWSDESSIDVLWDRPANHDGRLRRVLEAGAISFVIDAIGDNAGDSSVGSDVGEGGNEANEGCNRHERHVGEIFVEL